MKILNHKLTLLLFVMVSSISFSCKKQNDLTKPEPTPFSAALEEGVTTLPAAGGKLNIVISAGANGWWITPAQPDWVTITRMYGSGDFKLPVTIKANASGTARVVSIKVNPSFNLPAVTLNINQDK